MGFLKEGQILKRKGWAIKGKHESLLFGTSIGAVCEKCFG